MKMGVILGIGQSMRGDDGAGLEAVRRWQALYPAHAEDPGMRVELIELPGLALLDLLEEADQALLVDALRSGTVPGSLHRLREGDLAEFAAGSGSAHGWGAAETLALGRRLQPELMPLRIDLLGIEAGDVGMGVGLSPQVAGAMDEAVALIEEWVNSLNR